MDGLFKTNWEWMTENMGGIIFDGGDTIPLLDKLHPQVRQEEKAGVQYGFDFRIGVDIFCLWDSCCRSSFDYHNSYAQKEKQRQTDYL